MKHTAIIIQECIIPVFEAIIIELKSKRTVGQNCMDIERSLAAYCFWQHRNNILLHAEGKLFCDV